jgi:flavin reductase (DIM6/NTAB) family NADH-FMN oxidoreductase RutF
MEKEKISISTHAGEMIAALKKCAYLTAKADGRENTMAIGWGTVGVLWGREVFICYVRKSRFTRELLDKNPEFTVNMPIGEVDRKIFTVCGMQSGRDVDKTAEAGLTLVEGEKVSVPAIAEMPMTLECRVLYRREQDVGLLPPEMKEKIYPGEDPDSHVTYVGEILDAYIIRK